jgi:alanyl-tRNA synthetase
VTGQEIRQRFLQFFRSRDHLILESAPLVPVDDPTTLFISAGMQPLQPYYQGLRTPPHGRLASCQKCFRTGDLEEVGKTDRHQTFFEMLGNFAPAGDYFNETAIPLAWELVTHPESGFGLPEARLRVTTHPTDESSREIWRRSTGVRPEWIYENEDNWWGLELGPCGPDTELWWDRGRELGCGQPDCYPDHCARFVEFWNLVLPQYDKQPDGSLPPLKRPAIDTGMGLERIASILQGVSSNFDTDLFAPLIAFLRDATPPGSAPMPAFSERVIADHLRAMVFVIGDGVLPANEGRGYVLRRVIRRAALHARRTGLERPLADGVAVVVRHYRDQYPYLAEREAGIRAAVAAESDAFNRSLERGMEAFEQVAGTSSRQIAAADAFRLHDTFGFPLELTQELAAERRLEVDNRGFETLMEQQRERSRGAVVNRWSDLRSLPRSEFTGYDRMADDGVVVALRKGQEEVDEAIEGDEVEVYLDRSPFYAESGGQVGDTGKMTGASGELLIEDTKRPFEGVIAHLGRVTVGRIHTGEQVRAEVDRGRRRQIMRHHTATHLLNKALEELVGKRNLQRGSWVGPLHTTFDFSFDRALTSEELDSLERRMYEQVRAALPLHARVLPYDEAVQTGATHLFEEKYGDQVRVVCLGDWSCEFCGGTHVETSADVGPVLITAESSVGQGIRRIDLTAGEAAEALVRRRLGQVRDLAADAGVTPDQVGERFRELRKALRESERAVERLRDELRTARVRDSGNGATRRQARVPLILEEVQATGADDLRAWADRYLESMGGHGIVAVTSGPSFVVKVSQDLVAEHPATEFVKVLGLGGGSPALAQGRLTRPAPEAFGELEAALR